MQFFSLPFFRPRVFRLPRVVRPLQSPGSGGFNNGADQQPVFQAAGCFFQGGPPQKPHIRRGFLAGVWKGAMWSWGYLKSLYKRELRSYLQVSKHILAIHIIYILYTRWAPISYSKISRVKLSPFISGVK